MCQRVEAPTTGWVTIHEIGNYRLIKVFNRIFTPMSQRLLKRSLSRYWKIRRVRRVPIRCSYTWGRALNSGDPDRPSSNRTRTPKWCRGTRTLQWLFLSIVDFKILVRYHMNDKIIHRSHFSERVIRIITPRSISNNRKLACIFSRCNRLG